MSYVQPIGVGIPSSSPYTNQINHSYGPSALDAFQGRMPGLPAGGTTTTSNYCNPNYHNPQLEQP